MIQSDILAKLLNIMVVHHKDAGNFSYNFYCSSQKLNKQKKKSKRKPENLEIKTEMMPLIPDWFSRNMSILVSICSFLHKLHLLLYANTFY